MHRFFVPSEALATSPGVTLTGPLAHQIARVLRLRAGDAITLLDDSGDEALVRLTLVVPSRVTGEIERRQPGRGEPALHLTLYQAPLKGDHMAYVLQKGTEVGISAFVPLLTERVIARVVDERRLERWRQIIREAAEQSGRARLPLLAPPLTIVGLATRAPDRPRLALWEGETTRSLGVALRPLGRPLPPLALIVGPEGGLSADEVEQLRMNGALPVTLGPRVLRAETAGLVAAAALLYAAGDLGGLPA